MMTLPTQDEWARLLAAQVEALAAELQIKNAECDLFQHCCDIRDAELDRLKKQEPCGTIKQKLGYPDGSCWVHWKIAPIPGVDIYLSAGAQPDTKELDALRADAERYRWLRTADPDESLSVSQQQMNDWGRFYRTYPLEEELDDAIDAARAAS